MANTSIKSLRIPNALYEEIQSEAKSIGFTTNNYIISILNSRHIGGDAIGAKFYKKISKWILNNYSKDNFPPDITLKVFHHIKNDSETYNNYKEIVSKSKDAKISLHRKIGIMVKDILGAKVTGRSVPLDPEENLIKTYSFLGKK
jgi:hypothetical protein